MIDYQQPDAKGHFGIYGGSFVSETLTHAINELKAAYAKYQHDPEFIAEFKSELAHFVGRPSPVYHAARMSREMGGAQIFLKREDLNHTGAHKINNTIGQAMLAKRMGKPRIIARPVRASTAWPPPPSAPATVWNAWCTWAPKMSNAKARTSTA
jgi:tryptophan synthase beta chain